MIVLAWLERSALGVFMRESSLWTYPLVNLLHIFGIAALFGATLIIDLRLLGAWRRVPLGDLADAVDPVARAGFGLAVLSGVGLLAANATEYAGNPYLLIKFGAIAVGLVNVQVLSRSAAWHARRERPLPADFERRLAVMGGISLACWIVAVSAGRMIAYW